MDEKNQLDTRRRGGPQRGEPSGSVIGYASCALPGSAYAAELREQAAVITRECKHRGLELLEVVGERGPGTGRANGRPGLEYALDRLDSGAASGLVGVELSGLPP